uniref:Vesicle transport protein n=1 Tax=Rhipicephalus appendiculatus TaxID=34631 RepID=A0A131Z2E1_RHIAP
MGDINRQLRDYLSRNEARKESSIFASTESLKKLLSPSSGSSEPSSNGASSNGWFSEAANDSCLPSLSRKQRIVGFAGMLLMGCFCMVLAGLYIPVLVFKARKFALLYTLGSLFIISSFALLRGPMNHIKHLLSLKQLPFTTAYFGTTFATLYFALVVKSTLFTVLFTICQCASIIWFVLASIPGGETGLKFFSRVFTGAVTRTASKTLPV